ncbi:MAG: hypothetical protein IJW99_02215 [Clostridia bacterium]|nr:hypothetical protein [Clostridia bacterium]
MEKRLFIGVDGGGTKTALTALDGEGREQASAFCPPLNYHFIGVDAALAHLRQGLDALQVPHERIAAVGIGDPALDDVTSGAAAHRFAAAARELLGVPVYIRSDAYMTLYALTGGEGPGVLTISGTGAMSIAENASGEIFVAGGWGRLTGDEGSGYYIGLCGIRAALHAADGITPPTSLLGAALDHFGCETSRALIDVFYGEREPDVAGFARRVATCAETGDGRAAEILSDAAGYLADYTAVLMEKSGADRVGVYGSVLCRNRAVREEFERRILSRYPSATVAEPTVSAQVAAALYAKNQWRKEETV